MSLIFYDTETTGTETFFDQILQFAAIKTDNEFNELERFEIRCRLLPYNVAAPGAMRVTGVTVAQLTDPALPSHYEMMCAIRAKLMEWSPATFMGYNSLQFDEVLMRQAFYKTLHLPYLTNSDGNSRSDVMRAVQACSLFAPGLLNVPVNEKGDPVFKLDHLAPANGFDHANAHDALADVEATIFMCKLLSEQAPDVWSAFMRFSTKASVIDYINEERVFCLSDHYFNRPFAWLVTIIGQNPDITNEWFAYDLSVDPDSFLGLSDTQIQARLKRSPKVVRKLKANGVPVIFPAEEAPSICKAVELGGEFVSQRAERLANDPDLKGRLVAAMLATKEEFPSSGHVEEKIYDGFFDADAEMMAAFHVAPWEERLAVVGQFTDARLREIGARLVHCERPDLFDANACREHEQFVAGRLLAEQDGLRWMTLPKAIAEADKLLAEAVSPSEIQLLTEHREHLLHRLGEVRRLV